MNPRTPIVRTPVRIVGHNLPDCYDAVVGHEATVYSGGSPVLNALVRLSEEGIAVCPGRRAYLRVEDVLVETITTPRERVLL